MANTVSITGNLTRDPETRFVNETQITSFSIGHNRRRKRGDSWEDEANYFDVVCFGNLAERAAEHLQTGTGVRVDGTLKQNRWETQDGQKRSRVEIFADDIVFFQYIPKAEAGAPVPSSDDAEREAMDDIPF